jgi:hypothetical protein
VEAGGTVTTVPAADQLAEDVLALVRAVLDATRCSKPEPETPLVVSLDYERFIEAPRRAGIDPTFRSLMAEAKAAQGHDRIEGAA